ncbi:MAG: aldo/keto reductase [Bacteroidota bacterium]|nr:aldo/keto reductase [Bacteroidota bacterium]
MNYRTLGTTTIRVSEISLGCWTMGGLNWVNGVPNGWANVDEKEIAGAIDYAVDHGVNHFDTADVYGNGRSERMLARILGKRTNDMIIATKVGHFPGTAEHAYDPLHIRHQCEQSLKNLSRQHIDVYYFHHGDFGESDYYLDDAVTVMYRLKEEGKIRAVGQSAYSNEDFLRVVPKVKPDVLQSSASAMDDHYIADGSPVRKLLDERKMSFVAFGPLGQGLLLGKYSKSNPPAFEPGDHRANAPRFSGENLAKLEPKLQRLKEKFGSRSENLARAALQYLLYYKVTGAVIPGFRNLAQVKVNLTAADSPLTKEEFEFIKNVFTGMQ